MDDVERPILILMMGEKTAHAELSIEYFYPASVHIITSEKFGQKYEEILDEWSSKYDFRRGTVNAVDNLFTPLAIQSLLFSSFHALDEEVEKTGDVAWKRSKLIGITGGTMHMAAAGTYLGQLINSTTFYVMKPPEGQAPVAKRDIIAFPTLRGINFISSINVEDIDYILSSKQGSLQEFHKDTGLQKRFVITACELGMFGINPEKDEWWITPLGWNSFGFITQSRVWKQFINLIQSLNDKDGDKDDFDPSIM